MNKSHGGTVEGALVEWWGVARQGYVTVASTKLHQRGQDPPVEWWEVEISEQRESKIRHSNSYEDNYTDEDKVLSTWWGNRSSRGRSRYLSNASQGYVEVTGTKLHRRGPLGEGRYSRAKGGEVCRVEGMRCSENAVGRPCVASRSVMELR